MNGFKVVEQTRFCHRNCYTQKYISKSHGSCALARRPMLVNIFMKFHEYILKGFKVKERTRFCKNKIATCKVQMGIIQNIYMQELWFLRSACRPALLNIYMTIS